MAQSPIENMAWDVTYIKRRLAEEAEKLSGCASNLLDWIAEEYQEEKIAVELVTVARDVLDSSNNIQSNMRYFESQFAKTKLLLEALLEVREPTPQPTPPPTP